MAAQTGDVEDASARPPLSDEAPHILVVDDDRRLRELLSRFLGENGYRVSTAASTAEAEAKSGSVLYDAMVLDVMMPGESGFDYMRRVRASSATPVPILMLTARFDIADRLRGLELGADDYLAKPFEPRELILRLGNILRRAPSAPTEPERPATDTIRFGAFTFRVDRGELRRGDEAIRITEREREILTILGARSGEDVSREELAGSGQGANERTVDVQMNRLRRKIEVDPANPLLLQTVRGVGYRLVLDP